MVLSGSPRAPRLGPTYSKIAACAIAAFFAALDFATQASYSVPVFYGFALAILAWCGSRKFLWTVAGLSLVSLFVAAFLRSPSHNDWIVWVNRSLTAVSLLVIAGLVDKWMANLEAVETQRKLSRALLHTLERANVTIRKLDGTILFWSRGAERLYGWSAEEAVGQFTHELFGVEFLPEQMLEIQRRFEEQGQWIGELQHVRKNRSRIWVASQWTIYTTDLFPFPVVTEVNNDITELKLAENRFRHLTEILPHVIWQASPTGTLSYVNQRWREYFGRDPQEIALTPTGMAEFLHPDDLSHSAAKWQRALETGQVDTWEMRLRRHDGVYRWFMGRALAVRNESGEIVQWIATATDIEDERKVNERLRETQKLESIGRLAGGVAHDFNNLLTAIGGYNSFLSEEIQSNAAALAFSTEIKKAADRASALTKQLLSFSRPQLAKPTPVNLNHIVTDISRILQRVIGEDIQLLIRLAPDLPNILADPVQIDQIIMNLAVNARDAMPNGGTLRIETGSAMVGEVEARERQVAPGPHLTLTVQDTGVGMDQTTMGRLFEAFFTTKEEGKGTGLGLSIVFGVVKHSGGFIKVESSVGAGAKFTVVLPVSTAPTVETAPMIVEKAASGGGETILVVEDEEVVRRLVRDALRKRGYRVLEAATPSAGIELTREYGPQINLVLSDVLMPEMRGPELVSNIRKFRPDLAVMYMSGYSDSTFLDPTLLEGVAYIQKPFRPEELARRVAEVLAKTR
jgi:PAS domain S-box-containing protein